jgi:hypothetical protein
VSDQIYPYEEYEVIRDLTGVDPSDDLFAGVGAVPAR